MKICSDIAMPCTLDWFPGQPQVQGFTEAHRSFSGFLEDANPIRVHIMFMSGSLQTTENEMLIAMAILRMPPSRN